MAHAYFDSRAEKGFPLADDAIREEVLAKWQAAKAKEAEKAAKQAAKQAKKAQENN